MIARLRGQVVEKKDLAVILDVGGIFYDISVPVSVAQRLESVMDKDGCVTLVTYHYLQIGPSSGVPVLVGFLNDLEKDFFLQFISISGIGPKAAVRAMDRSICEIASAIDRGDIGYLKTLPGIGQQKAKDMVAKLQGKLSRFGLIQDAAVKGSVVPSVAFKDEALAVLMQLQYKRAEAEGMLAQALERNSGITTTEELLNEIYKQKGVR